MSPHTRDIFEIFLPRELRRYDSMLNKKSRFVHYTSADVGMSIIQNKEVWMRNARTMNDFSEVEHGLDCLVTAYGGDKGGELKLLLDDLFPGFSEEITEAFNAWVPHLYSNTFLSCVSEHDDEEDVLGRLSMWRAYGGRNGVALVINSGPFSAESTDFAPYSAGVNYFSSSQFSNEFALLVDRLSESKHSLNLMGREVALATFLWVFKFMVLCTKHPGFHEEREWRIIYSPSEGESPIMKKRFSSVRGVPQSIYTLPLVSEPESGLVGADVASILDRVIIGPSAHPEVIYHTFVELLENAGVSDPDKKVFISNIPLRE